MPPVFLNNKMFSKANLLLACITIALPTVNSFPFQNLIRHRFQFNNNVALCSSSNDEYRSISDVVGGLHGGKYQFNDNRGIQSFGDDVFSGYGSRNSCNDDEEELVELPNWAIKMEPDESVLAGQEAGIITVPSNSNPMDGMTYSSSVVIQTQERTWEKFYVKIMARRNSDDTFVQLENGCPINVKPRSGSLAPRGGASNACDASKPYYDSATIQVIHDNNVECSTINIDELWLVAGTEEEKWSYKLILDE